MTKKTAKKVAKKAGSVAPKVERFVGIELATGASNRIGGREYEAGRVYMCPESKLDAALGLRHQLRPNKPLFKLAGGKARRAARAAAAAQDTGVLDLLRPATPAETRALRDESPKPVRADEDEGGTEGESTDDGGDEEL